MVAVGYGPTGAGVLETKHWHQYEGQLALSTPDLKNRNQYRPREECLTIA